MSDRKLATVERILDIVPIPGADRISLAKVKGWSCVIAKKDSMKIGDLIVYFEIDSIVPDKPEFDFLKDSKFRIKSRKFKGAVSQGLIMLLSILPSRNWKEGDDVSDTIGVRKYDPEGDAEAKMMEQKEKIAKTRLEKYLYSQKWYRKLLRFLTGEKQKGFPSFLPKSDEERLQNLKDDFCEREQNTEWTVTRKIDGQSLSAILMKNPNRFMRLFGKPYIFILCSRNLKLGKYTPNNNYWKVAKKYDLENVMTRLIGNNEWVALQGESLAPGIQKNKYALTDNELYIYNLVYPTGRVDDKTFRPMLEREGLKVVPLESYTFKLGATVAESVEKAKLKSVLKPDTWEEGLVLRDYSRGISFKIINPEFLLFWDL
jgi:RNA ligase (TIGR02306 family)